ncbi:hypothetical protein EVAR_51031_1 [Eumeta japonica]|uniref:Uncharacterized protein n=1 Tax=Eumeta variegata TaxID=151549 RepID=A0A4C1Y7E0_EUMVA|nr:hypothetical protein EVAR_51031_1 [Eumeta japonica]
MKFGSHLKIPSDVQKDFLEHRRAGREADKKKDVNRFFCGRLAGSSRVTRMTSYKWRAIDERTDLDVNSDPDRCPVLNINSDPDRGPVLDVNFGFTVESDLGSLSQCQY